MTQQVLSGDLQYTLNREGNNTTYSEKIKHSKTLYTSICTRKSASTNIHTTYIYIYIYTLAHFIHSHQAYTCLVLSYFRLFGQQPYTHTYFTYPLILAYAYIHIHPSCITELRLTQGPTLLYLLSL